MKPWELPKPQRERLFSCALPYALALGVLGAWVAAFDALDHRLLLYWRDGEIVPDQT